MKRWLIRIVLALAIFEVAYVAVVNSLLNLPSTQDYINRLNPDRFRLQWEQAWSWYPLRLRVTAFSGNFQSWSQQWELETPEVSASLAIAPLLWKTALFYDMDGENVGMRFRPRPRPDRDDADVRQYYPTIEGRDPNLPAEPTPTQSPGWRMEFEIARASGQHNIWIAGTKTTLDGDVSGTIIHQGRHGPLTVEGGDVDLAVKTLSVDGQQVSDSGSLKGTIDFASFIPYENRGLKTLAFMSADLDIDLPVDGLDFLNKYLNQSTNLSLGGTGALEGRFVFDKGDLLAGTDLEISADGLTASQLPFRVDGSGKVDINVEAAAPKTISAAFEFDQLSLLDETDNMALFTGKDLKAAVDRPTYVLPAAEETGPSRVALDIPEMTIGDMSAYQRFLPQKWRVELLGGSGSLQGKAEMSVTKLDADLTLRSEDANVKFKEDSFETDLELVLKATGEASDTAASVDISSSSLALDDSRIKLQNGDTSNSWQAKLSVSTGKADFDLPETSAAGPGGFWKLRRDRDIRSLLAALDGQFNADLDISDLNWANDLIDNPYSLAFDGGAQIGTDLTIRSGYLAEGSKLAMQPQQFALEILDYIAEGDGGFALTVEKGGEEPDLNISANLKDASFRRKDEKQAVISDVTLAVNAATTGVSLTEGGKLTALDLTMPSAKVTSMTAYNAYLPKGSPVRILSGTADLNAKLDVQESSASGFVKLKTSRIDADLDGDRMTGTVNVDVKINDGSANDRRFDITGSSIVVDKVHVAGESAAAAQRGWTLRIDLGRSRVVWDKPASLDASASIRMTDTRPLIEIFQAHRKGNEWLERILNLKDVRGTATIKVEPNEFVIPYALAKSDTIEVGVKGFIRERSRQGMFYAKYGALAAILEFDNSKRRFSLINSTKKFEEYVPGGKLPGLHESGSQRSQRSEERKGPLSIFKRN